MSAHIPTPLNAVTQIAAATGRSYITPEDVSEALLRAPVAVVRLDVLAVIGKQTLFGVEDYSLCAFIAYRGKEDADKTI